MRFPRFIVTFSLLALAACLGDRHTFAPSDDARLFRQIRSVYDCQSSVQNCQAIQAGISFLTQHASPMCVQLGGYAQVRFNAPPGNGFKDSTWTGGDMGVVMVPGSSNSGMVPNSGNILVNSSFSPGTPSTDGPLIAHEEGGHMTGDDDMYHNTGVSYWIQAVCSEN